MLSNLWGWLELDSQPISKMICEIHFRWASAHTKGKNLILICFKLFYNYFNSLK